MSDDVIPEINCLIVDTNALKMPRCEGCTQEEFEDGNEAQQVCLLTDCREPKIVNKISLESVYGTDHHLQHTNIDY
jgi:hypothetical protein